MTQGSSHPQKNLRHARAASIAIAVYLLASITFDSGTWPVQLARIVLVAFALGDLAVRPFRAYQILLWQIAFVAWAWLTTTWAVNPDGATSMAMTLVVNGVCLVAIAYLIVGDEARMKIVVVCLMVAPILLMARIAASSGLFAFLVARSTDTTNANIVGTTAAFGVCLAFLSATQRTPLSRPLSVLLLVLNLSVVLLSASRKAIVAVAIVLVLYAMINRANHALGKLVRNLTMLGAVLVGYIAVMNVGVLYDAIGSRLESMVSGLLGEDDVDASTSTRLQLIDYGIEWFSRAPWGGHGGDAFRDLMALEQPRQTARYAHNNYIELLVDFGIIGLLLYYALYVVVISRGFRHVRKLSSMQAMWLSLVIGALVVEYGQVSYFDRYYTSLIVIAWAVICAKPHVNSSAERLPVTGHDRRVNTRTTSRTPQ